MLVQNEETKDEEQRTMTELKPITQLESLIGEQPPPVIAQNFNRLSQDMVNFVKQKCKYQEPIATVFFRFSHRNKKNQPLTNAEQKEIVDKIYTSLTEYLEKDHQHFEGSLGKKQE